MSKVTLTFVVMLLCQWCIAGEVNTLDRTETLMAIDADMAYGEYLASECSTCHVNVGASSTIPVIQGQDPKAIIQALLEYQNKTRANETMQSVAGALGDEEIAALARYFANQ